MSEHEIIREKNTLFTACIEVGGIEVIKSIFPKNISSTLIDMKYYADNLLFDYRCSGVCDYKKGVAMKENALGKCSQYISMFGKLLFK